MTNHPVAEQDSLEGLIARLRNGARFDDRIEAADTLCQMVDVLAEVRMSLSGAPHSDEVIGCTTCAVIAKLDAILGTTPKIEKDAL